MTRSRAATCAVAEGAAAAMFALDTDSDAEEEAEPKHDTADTFYSDSLPEDDFLCGTPNPGMAAGGLAFSFKTCATEGWGTLEEEGQRRALWNRDIGRATYLACVPARPVGKGAAIAEEFLFVATDILTEGKSWRSVWELTADPDDPWLLEGFRLRDANRGEICREDILMDACGQPAFLSPATASLRGEGKTTLEDSMRAATPPKSRDFLRGVAYFSTIELDMLAGEEDFEWSRRCVVEVLARSRSEALVRMSARGEKVTVAAAQLENEPVYSHEQKVRRSLDQSHNENPLQSLGDAWSTTGATRRIAACRCVANLTRGAATSEEIPSTAFCRALFARIASRKADADLKLFSYISVLPDAMSAQRAARNFFRAFFRASGKGSAHASPPVLQFQEWFGRFFAANRRKVEKRYKAHVEERNYAGAVMCLAELEGFEATACGLARVLKDADVCSLALSYFRHVYSAASCARWCRTAVDEQLIFLARGERIHLTFRGAWAHGTIAGEAAQALQDYVADEIHTGMERLAKHKDARVRALRDRLPRRATDIPWRGTASSRYIAAIADAPSAVRRVGEARSKRKATEEAGEDERGQAETARAFER